MDKLKSHYEIKLKEIVQLNKSTIIEKENKWTEEKHHLQKHLEFTQQQFEENRKMHKQLMAAINEKKNQDSSQYGRQRMNEDEQTQKITNDDLKQMRILQETNKMLSETVSKQEQKNEELSQKLLKLKVYSKCFKHSMAS